MCLTKSMRVALMSIHFNRWGEALWVEGVSPGPHEFKEGCPREFFEPIRQSQFAKL